MGLLYGVTQQRGSSVSSLQGDASKNTLEFFLFDSLCLLFKPTGKLFYQALVRKQARCGLQRVVEAHD